MKCEFFNFIIITETNEFLGTYNVKYIFSGENISHIHSVYHYTKDSSIVEKGEVISGKNNPCVSLRI